MKIRMIKTSFGSVNGFTVNTYVEGEIYDLGDSKLAEHLVRARAAVFVEEKKEPVQVESKALTGADLENKSSNKKGK